LKKRKRDAQRTQEKLLETAEQVFVEKGFDGARVDEIANLAAINKRMIYVFYGSKENLYIEVLRTTFRKLFKSNLPTPDPSGDPLADTEAIMRWYFWFLSDNPNYVRLLGWETLNDGNRAGKVLFELMEEGLGPLQKIVKLAREQGYIQNDMPSHKIVTILNEVCLGFFARRNLLEILWGQDLNDKSNQEDMLNLIIKIVMEGIRARDENGRAVPFVRKDT